MHIQNLAGHAEFSDAGPTKKVLYENPELTSILISLKGGQEIPAHTLSSEVIMHVVSGEGSFHTGDGVKDVNEGGLFVCGPDEPHGIMAKSDMVVLVAKVAGR